MFSFDKTIKKYDGNDEIDEVYSFFIFTNNITSPNIVKYMNDGTPVQYNMIPYNNDFLDIKTSISNVFYYSYNSSGYTENYSIYDGSFLIYENLSQEYSDNEDEEESKRFTEIPKSPTEDMEIEFKTVHHQLPGYDNWFETYYYCKGNMNVTNVLRINYTLPKELQISSWNNPQKITESEFLELVNNYDDEEDDNVLYEVVSDDNDEEILYYKVLSYINDNLIILDVDYTNIGTLILSGSGASLRNLFNDWQNSSRNRVKRYSNSRATFFSNSMFYNGIPPTPYNADNFTMSTTYDGYSTIKGFYPANNTSWNGGYLQDYYTSFLLLAGFDNLGYENYNIPNYINPEDFCVLWQDFRTTNL